MTLVAVAQRALSEGTAVESRAVVYQSMQRNIVKKGEVRAMVECAKSVAQLPTTFPPKRAAASARAWRGSSCSTKIGAQLPSARAAV